MLEPCLKDFLAVWDEKWSRLGLGATADDRRLAFEAIAREMRLATPDDVETGEEHWIASPAGPVRVRIFRHRDGGVQPALVYMHGGGWSQGSPETHWDITARIAAWAKMTVISVDYALAPEHPYPAAFHQCCAVLRWAHDNAADLKIDPRRLGIGGDSAGGNLAAAVTLWAREEGLALKAQLLIYAPCDFDHSRRSYIENAEGPLLKVAAMRTTDSNYCPDADRLKSDPYVAPLVASSHSGLPPAYIAVAQYDPHRDNGRAYADALQAAGVSVTYDEGKGLIHGYLRAMEYCSESEERLRAMCDWLASHL